MSFDPITAALDLGGKLIDKLFPDPAQRDAAKLQLLTMQQNGELEAMKAGISVMLAEAQSTDPWTSRARPSFMYVFYILILAALPMGALSAFSPDTATNIANGFKMWLQAIPEAMWTTFGVGYLGYTAARQYGKIKGSDK